MQTLYTAESTAWGGREGRAASSDGNLDVQLTMPKEIGGPGGAGTNPEQLLATGWAACFHSALKLVAKADQLDVSESAITVRVSLGMDSHGGFGLSAEIEAELPGLDAAAAQALVDKSHTVCPFSKALHTIDVKLTLVED